VTRAAGAKAYARGALQESLERLEQALLCLLGDIAASDGPPDLAGAESFYERSMALVGVKDPGC